MTALLGPALLFLRGMWEQAKRVPAWLWAVAALLLALFLVYREHRHGQKIVLLVEQRKARERFRKAREAASDKRVARMEGARARHEARVSAIREKESDLDKLRTSKEIADAANDAFGGEE